jgi:hypothetical protein
VEAIVEMGFYKADLANDAMTEQIMVDMAGKLTARRIVLRAVLDQRRIVEIL